MAGLVLMFSYEEASSIAVIVLSNEVLVNPVRK